MVAAVRWLPVLAGLLLAAGCPWDPCAGTDDLLAGPEGIRLTVDEHAAGWGKDACTQCHNLETTHQVDCSDSAELDMEAIRREAEDGTYESCAGCHGDNGVAP
jgi:hypothetical protein